MKTKRGKPKVAYRFFTDKQNYEGVAWECYDKDILITWIWAGTGQIRQPVATVHKERIVVTWTDGCVWSMPARVIGGAHLQVQLAKG